MAGTPVKVRLTGNYYGDVVAMARALNQLITDFDAHTHGGITVGAAASGVPSALTTATPIRDGAGNPP